jgi:hypothetical protein
MPIDSGTRSEIEIQLSKLVFFIQIEFLIKQIFLETFMLSQARRSGSPVLIISYEAFRSYSAILHKGTVGLIICDEVSFIEY